jgi:RHS repeat-associated protein
MESYESSEMAARVLFGNGVVEESRGNERGQMLGRSWKSGSTVLLGLSYDWGGSVRLPVGNNGNLLTQTINGTRQGGVFTFTQNYEYDPLNRLQLVKDSGVTACGSGSWRQKFVYDRYGNRALLQGSCGNASGESVAWVANESSGDVENLFPGNRWADGVGGARHNASGNVVRMGGQVLEYDAENRLARALTGGYEWKYRYNGEGRRVAGERWNNGALELTRSDYYGAEGELPAEVQGALPTGWERKHVGLYHLGSTRLVLKASGSGFEMVDSRHDYLPFGEEVPDRGAGYGDAAVVVKFTGKERDAETGLDYFGARYLSSGLGRFTGVDPDHSRPLWQPGHRRVHRGSPPMSFLFTLVRLIALLFALCMTGFARTSLESRLIAEIEHECYWKVVNPRVACREDTHRTITVYYLIDKVKREDSLLWWSTSVSSHYWADALLGVPPNERVEMKASFLVDRSFESSNHFRATLKVRNLVLADPGRFKSFDFVLRSRRDLVSDYRTNGKSRSREVAQWWIRQVETQAGRFNSRVRVVVGCTRQQDVRTALYVESAKSELLSTHEIYWNSDEGWYVAGSNLLDAPWAVWNESIKADAREDAKRILANSCGYYFLGSP